MVWSVTINMGLTPATVLGLQALATDLHGQLHAGAAERALMESLQLLNTSMNAAEHDAGWRAVLQQEIADVERIK